MKGLLGIGISVGVLAGVWTQVSVELALVTWVAFLAWACFFAAGGGTTGLRQGLAANLSGLAWAWVASQVLEVASFPGALAVVVTVLGFVLCVQATLPLLGFIPGAFVGTAAFFGTGFDLVGTLVALIAGGLLGLASEVLGAKLQHLLDGRGRSATATPAPSSAPGAPAAPA